MATRNMDNSRKVDLAEVQKVLEFIKKSAVAEKNEKEYKREESILSMMWLPSLQPHNLAPSPPLSLT